MLVHPKEEISRYEHIHKYIIHKNEFRFKKDFVELGLLGQGDFGEVYKVRQKMDGLLYALKRTRNPLKGSREE